MSQRDVERALGRMLTDTRSGATFFETPLARVSSSE